MIRSALHVTALHVTELRRAIVSFLLPGILSVSWITATAIAAETPEQYAEFQNQWVQMYQRARFKAGPWEGLADWAPDDDVVEFEFEIADKRPAAPESFRYSDDAFNLLVYSTARTADESNSRLEVILSNKIEAIDRVCQLDDTQKEKLHLAGHGSITRCFDRVEELRIRYRSATDYRSVHELNVDATPLRFLLTFGPFGDRSLFGKTLRKTLSAEQAAKFELLK